ncbi:unnamed protein product [Miscanthus lutarioriparius]|uniref:Uncharacterized protein n=1 Tax=Miscanthus lutarioriparius TaxID=422564 RepID=A0A811P5Z8_9POAL|nr:unnamed protein product [Miscanthus lutarioriparius]
MRAARRAELQRGRPHHRPRVRHRRLTLARLATGAELLARPPEQSRSRGSRCAVARAAAGAQLLASCSSAESPSGSPFVMNTEEEINMTVNDFECYANGFEKARHCKSQAMVVGAHVPPPIVARSCGCRRGEEWACVDAEELKPLVDHRDPCTEDSDEREAIRE